MVNRTKDRLNDERAVRTCEAMRAEPAGYDFRAIPKYWVFRERMTLVNVANPNRRFQRKEQFVRTEDKSISHECRRTTRR
jgi:hypothetical protein